MEYYQKAAQAIRSAEERPINALKNAGLAALGGGAATLGSKAVGKILPSVGALISKYVPENIAVAGLSKIDLRLGSFVKGAIDEGYGFNDVREFLGEKVEKSESPKEDRNIIQQYSPNLHQYIADLIKNGSTPTQAATKASKFLDKKEQDIIKKIEKDHKTPFINIVESIFGGGLSNQSQAPEQMQEQMAGPQTMQPMQGSVPQGQQGGQGQQQSMNNLMQTLDMAIKMRQKRQGQ